MKYVLIIHFLVVSYLFAADNGNHDNHEKIRIEKNIQKQIKKEEKYAKEQTFYSGEKYNLKDAEVNIDSVKNLPDVPNYNEDFNMDDVYD